MGKTASQNSSGLQRETSERRKNEVDEIISVEEFSQSNLARDIFEEDIKKLDQQAEGVNNAVISDSLRFNGGSLVRHADPFKLEERIVMALSSQK